MVEAISEIGTVINEITDISQTIASAVEEQTSTAQEISQSVALNAGSANERCLIIKQMAFMPNDIQFNFYDKQLK